jgi:hypothetical protein
VQRAVGKFRQLRAGSAGRNDYLTARANGFVHLPWDIDYSLGLGPWPGKKHAFETADPRFAAMFQPRRKIVARVLARGSTILVNGPFNNRPCSTIRLSDARVNALLTNNIDIDLNAVGDDQRYFHSGSKAFISRDNYTTVAVPFTRSWVNPISENAR